MTSREFPLNAASCRLLQNIMPGLETAVVFQEKASEVYNKAIMSMYIGYIMVNVQWSRCE